MGVMRIMGLSGDDKLTWDHNDDLQTKKARTRFAELLEKGFRAYISKDIAGSLKGERITEFDPTAERLIMVPPMAGG
jgi:hypothetical protein